MIVIKLLQVILNMNLGAKIRDEISEAEKLIDQLNQSLQRMAKNKKKITQAEIDLRYKLMNKYKENIENLKSRELGECCEDEFDAEKPAMMKDY